MSLQIKVRKDIFKYQERIYLGMTLRQAITTYPTGLVVLALVFSNLKFNFMSPDMLQYLILVIAIPPLSIGWITLKEMPLEKYFLYYYRHHFMNQERYFRNEWTEVKPVVQKRKKAKHETEVEIYD